MKRNSSEVFASILLAFSIGLGFAIGIMIAPWIALIVGVLYIVVKIAIYFDEIKMYRRHKKNTKKLEKK